MPTTIVLLALSPGTQLTGLALFRNGELTDWEVHSFKGPWNRQKQKKMRTYFQALLRGAGITHLAVRLPLEVAPSLQWMLSLIKEQAEKQGAVVRGFPLYLLKETFSPSAAINRRALQEAIVRAEPELAASLPGLSWRKEYYSKMIEAIGVGRACLQRLNDSPDVAN